METRNVAAQPDRALAETDSQHDERPEKQWESFPQPADCSVKWDFEGLSQPPRARDRTDAAGTASGNAR
ncbi:MAG: hypothetical protein MUF84_07710 [Anaerolineae bacterium]|jgi:hypothetical protein|nr:hypothetical protein [Anaerolineae bacterium]